MRKLGIIAVLSMLVVALAAVPALAQNPHFATGAEAPVCTLDAAGTTVSCTGTDIAGVGNANAVATLTVTASADILCHNPGNQNVVEPHTTTFSDTTSSGIIEAKNGRLLVPALSETVTPADVTPDVFTCPNPNWTAETTDVTITSFTYDITFVGETEPFFTVSGP
jgi:hypothetical protein